MENRDKDYYEGWKNGFMEGIEKPLVMRKVLKDAEQFERVIYNELQTNEFATAYYFQKRHLVKSRETFEKGYRTGIRTGQILSLFSLGFFTAWVKCIRYNSREETRRNDGHLPHTWEPKNIL